MFSVSYFIGLRRNAFNIYMISDKIDLDLQVKNHEKLGLSLVHTFVPFLMSTPISLKLVLLHNYKNSLDLVVHTEIIFY